jgi:hypothetical protein
MTENERFVGGGFLVLNGGILRFWSAQGKIFTFNVKLRQYITYKFVFGRILYRYLGITPCYAIYICTILDLKIKM